MAAVEEVQCQAPARIVPCDRSSRDQSTRPVLGVSHRRPCELDRGACSRCIRCRKPTQRVSSLSPSGCAIVSTYMNMAWEESKDREKQVDPEISPTPRD